MFLNWGDNACFSVTVDDTNQQKYILPNHEIGRKCLIKIKNKKKEARKSHRFLQQRSFTFLNSVHSSTRVLRLLMNFWSKLSEILLLWLSDMHMRYCFLPKKHLPVYNFRQVLQLINKPNSKVKGLCKIWTLRFLLFSLVLSNHSWSSTKWLSQNVTVAALKPVPSRSTILLVFYRAKHFSSSLSDQGLGREVPGNKTKQNKKRKTALGPHVPNLSADTIQSHLK